MVAHIVTVGEINEWERTRFSVKYTKMWFFISLRQTEMKCETSPQRHWTHWHFTLISKKINPQQAEVKWIQPYILLVFINTHCEVAFKIECSPQKDSSQCSLEKLNMDPYKVFFNYVTAACLTAIYAETPQLWWHDTAAVSRDCEMQSSDTVCWMEIERRGRTEWKVKGPHNQSAALLLSAWVVPSSVCMWYLQAGDCSL